MRDQPGFNRGTSRSSFASKRSAWNTEQWYQPLTVSPACSDAESGLTAQRVSTDNQTWTASLSLTASAEVYAKCTNGSGLVSSGWVGTIYVDSTLPSGTVTETPTACTNGYISLSLHPTDSPSGIAQSWGNFSYDPTGSAVSVSGGGDLTIASPTQNTSFDWWTQDQAGHITSSSFAVTNLDRSAPTNPTGSASELNHQVGDGAYTDYADPAFSWTASADAPSTSACPGVSQYNLYWGTDPAYPTAANFNTATPSFTPAPLTEPGRYTLWVQAQDAAGNRSEWVKRFTYRYQSQETVRVFVPASPGLLYTVRWAEDSPSPATRYTVKSLLPGGTWQTVLTDTSHTQVELFGNAGSGTNQVCVQPVGGAWSCSALFSTAAKVTKVYSLGTQTVAVRVENAQSPTQSQLAYLSGDQVSSTSLVTDSTGNIVSQSRYTAFGQVRLTDGSLPTDRTYTGQRDDGMGLMDYQARMYDPYLNRFLSPDPIVPDPNNPLDWDRYSYVRNNPIAYSDPSGNKPCNGKNSNSSECDQITNNDLLGSMKWAYGWTTRGKFLDKQLDTILDAGDIIANYISSSTGKWGQGWVRSHLGNAIFNQGSMVDFLADKIFHHPPPAAFVFPYHDVNLVSRNYDSSTIVHELGHVLDNNNITGIYPATFAGGGPADKMVRAMGGTPAACNPRLQCWSGPQKPLGYQWYFDNVAGNSPWPSNLYGNNGVSDDFAEAFRWTIVDFSQVPSGRLLWMQNYLSSLP